ncbi:MAG: cobyrinate a,c-diamide synthase [Deltaproteobacteria bacterium]|nr:cobyrinate a,c-diamide synthase [Deltaproteobacteria bacterium]MBW2199781.1 cobyrinate a,c-diamide synthase [Deltaproteobacteria bacterium]MBW2538141.1 cobyrinate a,c-diamide synthase [Deltaproteobacteria bacterium]
MQQKGMNVPRIIISALRGGAGKTVLSIGIIAAWKALGISIAPFKKGPDYIDTGWLALAAGRPCYNLDTFLIPQEKVFESFRSHAHAGDIAVIEGNRGLYDGIDMEGSTSTAEIAKLLNTPVVLCINCTKSTRTMAAVVSGCDQFDPDVRIKGVILNHVAGSRHENILRSSIEHHCDIPVLGAVPKLKRQYFPERHMGLVPTPEHAWAQDSVDTAAQIAKRYLDLDALRRVAQDADPLRSEVSGRRMEVRGPRTEDGGQRTEALKTRIEEPGPRIGIIKDSAFQFYYPENIEALELLGAQTVFVSPLQDDSLPDLDALYIGGGFPETHAKALAANRIFRDKIKSLAEGGFPIYAECGGLMYLGEELVLEDRTYPMTGVLPIVFSFSKKPQGHGYSIVLVEGENPYFKVGTKIRGHEFHYSKVLKWGGADKDLVFRMQRGKGIHNSRDGICYKNVLATYSHIHALGTPGWAEAMVHNAGVYKKLKKGQPSSK